MSDPMNYTPAEHERAELRMLEDMGRCEGRRCWKVTGCATCGARNHDDWRCTLPRGHSGPHVACGGDHDLASWPNPDAAGPEPEDSADLVTIRLPRSVVRSLLEAISRAERGTS